MKFGILSTANIARKAFVPGIERSKHEVRAVASRDHSRAESFAEEIGATRAYGAYEDLLVDVGLDAVYVPLQRTARGMDDARRRQWAARPL